MRLFFWNVRHLSAGSDDARKNVIKGVYEGVKPDYALFCELTTKSTVPQAQNLTYRKENPSQLCYGCLDSAGNNVALTISDLQVTDEYKKAKFKGGNDFSKLADRALGYMNRVGGVYVYVIHAPAGSDGRPGRKAMSFIGCFLNKYFGKTPWLVIGDFNVEPDMLSESPVGIQMGDLIKAPSEPTYIGPSRNAYFDYVLCNFKDSVSVARVRTSMRLHNSDHYPIIAEW
jgi:hypothetical protein